MSNTIQRPTLFRSDDPTRPLSGGLVYFYEAGTTTPLTIYSDRTFATPIANPVVLDAGGRAPTEVFVPDGVAYKIRIEDSLGVLQYESDDLVAASSSDQTITVDAARQLLGYLPTVDPATPAVGDGVADDTTALANAINNSTAPVIDLGGKTYRITDEIDITRGEVTIRNGTIDMTDLEGTSEMFAFRAESTVTGTVNITTLSLSRGDSVIDVTSTAGYAAGDIIFVSAWIRIDGSADVGELVRVLQVNSGTQLTVSRPLVFGYPIANNPTIRRIDSPKTVRFENVKFVGGTPLNPAHTRGAILLGSTDRSLVDACTFDSVYSEGVRVDGCLDTSIDRCLFKGMVDPSLGYAVKCINGSSGTRVEACRADACNRLFSEDADVAGFGFRTRVRGCSYTGTGQLAWFGGGSVESYLTDCDGSQSGGGATDDLIFFGGLSGTIDSAQLYNANRTGINVSPLYNSTVSEIPKSYAVLNCDVKSSGEHGILFFVSPTSSPTNQIFVDSINVTGCKIDGAGVASHGIFVFAGEWGTIQDVDLVANIIRKESPSSGPFDGARIESGAFAGQIYRITIAGGYYSGSDIGIRVTATGGSNIIRFVSINGTEADAAIGASLEGTFTAQLTTMTGCRLRGVLLTGRALRILNATPGPVTLSGCLLRDGQYVYENGAATADLKLNGCIVDTGGVATVYTGNVATYTDTRLI